MYQINQPAISLTTTTQIHVPVFDFKLYLSLYTCIHHSPCQTLEALERCLNTSNPTWVFGLRVFEVHFSISIESMLCNHSTSRTTSARRIFKHIEVILPSPTVRFRSVVVITSASHAEGPGFEPQRNQIFYFFCFTPLFCCMILKV